MNENGIQAMDGEDRKHLCQAVHECFTDLNINVVLTF